MKNWLIFGGGVVTGIVLIILVAFVYSTSKSSKDNGITWFEKEGDVIEVEAFEVFQVIAKDAALAHGKRYGDFEVFTGAVYLLTNDNGKYYYDDEIVEVPDGKEVRQVGIYRYQSKSFGEKTIPIVKIMSK